jgi:hypothetical protein
MQTWFCLNNDGEIYCVGQFISIQEADMQADKMGLSAIWLFDQETADKWINKLKRC